MSTLKSTAQFVDEARTVHGDRYDYSHVDYVNTKSPTTIICPIHGAFEQRPYTHLQGAGCARCGREKPRRSYNGNSAAAFIEKSVAKHPNERYDYSQVVYVNQKTPVTIICPEHGSFEQKPYVHLSRATLGDRYCGCPRCGARRTGEGNTRKQEDVISSFVEQHGNRYDYSRVKYRGWRELITIVCQEHGPFEQRAQNHLNGQGCRKCQIDGFRLDAETYLTRVAGIYDQAFDYPNLDRHVLASDRISVVCPSHGRFDVHSRTHLEGRSGCPSCTQSGSRFERQIKQHLAAAGIRFETQWSHPSLTYKRRLRFDFMLPDLNMLIEFDGAFHHKPIQMPGQSWDDAVRTHEQTLLRDSIKTAWADENGWNLIRINRPNVRRALTEANVLPASEHPSAVSQRGEMSRDQGNPKVMPGALDRATKPATGSSTASGQRAETESDREVDHDV